MCVARVALTQPTRLLPTPTRRTESALPAVEVAAKTEAPSLSTSSSKIPAYPHRATSSWIPAREADYDDGGAYPEIVGVDQYPRGMGRGKKESTNGALGAALDGAGGVSWGAVVREGADSSLTIYDSVNALVERGKGAVRARPSRDEVAANAEATQASLANMMHATLTDAKARGRSTLGAANMTGNTEFIKYTPNAAAAAKTGITQRVIKMVDLPVDPLEPSRFRHKKRPGGAPKEAPVPVLHAPEKKATKEEKAVFDIPAPVSNWKNPNGFAIPLDKRLASQGIGLVAPKISDRFAKFTDALDIAEAAARERVEAMAQLEKERKLKEQAKEDEELREIAREARAARQLQETARRAGISLEGGAALPPPPASAPSGNPNMVPINRAAYAARTATGSGGGVGGEKGKRERSPSYSYSYSYSYSDSDDDEGGGGGGGGAGGRSRKKAKTLDGGTAVAAAAGGGGGGRSGGMSREERDAFRESRKKAREAERRKAASGRTRDANRDISELVALGRAKPTGTADALYDARLFNQTGGLSANINPDEDGGAGFSGPLFTAQRQKTFVPSATFAGASESSRASGRPVEFEKGHALGQSGSSKEQSGKEGTE